mgnify:CR=1 FL=1
MHQDHEVTPSKAGGLTSQETWEVSRIRTWSTPLGFRVKTAILTPAELWRVRRQRPQHPWFGMAERPSVAGPRVQGGAGARGCPPASGVSSYLVSSDLMKFSVALLVALVVAVASAQLRSPQPWTCQPPKAPNKNSITSLSRCSMASAAGFWSWATSPCWGMHFWIHGVSTGSSHGAHLLSCCLLAWSTRWRLAFAFTLAFISSVSMGHCFWGTRARDYVTMPLATQSPRCPCGTCMGTVLRYTPGSLTAAWGQDRHTAVRLCYVNSSTSIADCWRDVSRVPRGVSVSGAIAWPSAPSVRTAHK